MKRNPANNMFIVIYKNIAILLVVVFCFILGLSIGIFTEILLSPEERESIQSFLDLHLFLSQTPGKDLPYVFLLSVASNLSLIIVIALSGLTIIGFPAALLVVLYKGAALGFTATLLIDALSFKGVFLILLTMVPQNIILIPVTLAAAIGAINLALSVLVNGPRNIKKGLADSAGNFIAFILILSVFLIGGCFIESFISPFLQQLLG